MKSLQILIFVFSTYCLWGQSKPDVIIYKTADYRGGIGAFSQEFGWKYRYPKSAKQAKYTGKVIVNFTVKTTGKPEITLTEHDQMNWGKEELTDEEKVKVIDDLDTEIKRVFDKMPLWIPGSDGGVPVESKMVIPLKIG